MTLNLLPLVVSIFALASYIKPVEGADKSAAGVPMKISPVLALIWNTTVPS